VTRHTPTGPAGPASLQEALPAHGWRELWLLPLTQGGSVVGRLDLAFTGPLAEAADGIQLTWPLRHQAGLAIARERQVQALTRRTAGLLRLQEGLLGLTQGSSTAQVLRNAIDLSRTLTPAAYAAVAVWNADGALVHFETAGVSVEARARIGHGPQGIGLLAQVAAGPVPVRVADALSHPAARSLPPGHPPVRSFLGVPIPHLGSWRGAFYLTGSPHGREFSREDEERGQVIAAHVAAILQPQRLVATERETHTTRLQMLVSLSDAREHAVERHSHRVRTYAHQLGTALEVEPGALDAPDHGALLLDIGKMGIPDHILQKPGPLTNEERAIMMATHRWAPRSWRG